MVIGEGAMQDTPQDPRTTDMASYGMAEYSSPPIVSDRIRTCLLVLSSGHTSVGVPQLNTVCIPRPMEDLLKVPQNNSRLFSP